MSATVRQLVTRLVLKVARLFNSSALLRLAALVADGDVKSQRFVMYAGLRHFSLSDRNLQSMMKYVDSQPTSALVTPLVARWEHFEAGDLLQVGRPIAGRSHGGEYLLAMVNRQFEAAYKIWSSFPEVQVCLEYLSGLSVGTTTQPVAVVLPGVATDPFGKEIDDAFKVARTSLLTPTAEQRREIGSRTDIAFLNLDRYRKLLKGGSSEGTNLERIVTMPSSKRLGFPKNLGIPIEFSLPNLPSPTSAVTMYIVMRIVPWCFANGLRPVLYNADFYLSDAPYHSEAYDPEAQIQVRNGVVDSYLRHDVFYCHAALKTWRELGMIRARGRLGDLLELSGANFAGLLEQRWGNPSVHAKAGS